MTPTTLDPAKRTLETMAAQGWARFHDGDEAGVPSPVLTLLRHALHALEDHIDYGTGDRAECVIAVAQASAVVGRWIA
ncbi:hypothetical protein ACPXB3_00505 [Gordonia sp. DT219]|uniref:hypothetical protein n=1 Tax=Gordonia sp. DT219 TaxID=3416658 RepID=UPI003CF3BA79